MIRALCWKEYREQRAIWLAIAGLTAVLVLGLGAALAPGGLATLHDDLPLRGWLAFAVVSMAATYGLVCGALLLAGEREAGTLGFLDVLASRRAPVWAAKVLSGLALTLAQVLLLAAVAVLAGLVRGVSPVGYLGSLGLLALDGYSWGLLGSALCGNVFVGALLGAASLGASWGVTALLGWLVPGPLLVSQLLMAAVAVVASGLIFCRPDRRRTIGRPLAVAGRYPDIRALVWLTLRQGRAEACVLLGAGAVLGVLLPQVERMVWLLLLTGLGVVSGTAVFAGDQPDGRRFLGAERLSPGRVWAVKTGCWAGLTALLAGMALLGSCAVFVVRDLVSPMYGDPAYGAWRGPLERYFQADDFPGVGRGWLLAAFLLYGFSAGQVVGLIVQKRVVALVLALVLAGSLLGLWLPSLLLGGLPAWRLLVPPVLLLLAGRLVMWPWLADRLQARRSVAALLSCGLLIVLWMTGSLWYRAVELPDGGPPFNTKAFEAGLAAPDRRAAELIRQAWRELRDHERRVSARLARLGLAPGSVRDQQPDESAIAEASICALLGSPLGQGPLLAASVLSAPRGVATAVSPSEYFYEQLQEALDKGWPKEAGNLDRWLDEVFAGEWAGQLRQAAALPLCPLWDPRSLQMGTDLTKAQESRFAVTLFLARAAQLQARGKERAALDQLAVVLGLSRQLRYKAPLLPTLVAWGVEAMALDGLDRWLAKLGPRPELLRRAVDELTRHEEQKPPLAETVKAEYFAFRSMVDQVYRPGHGLWRNLIAFARAVPWEKERETRLVNAYFAAMLRHAETPYWQRHETALREETARWQRTLQDSLVGSYVPTDHELLKVQVWDLCRLRAERLRIALALYEIQEGKPAAQLSALVPRYLAEVPLDPFSGRPFGYRVSRGERIPTFTGVHEAGAPLDVAAGQGVVWSTGPDRKDNGGRRAGPLYRVDVVDWWTAEELGAVFLVPHWPKR